MKDYAGMKRKNKALRAALEDPVASLSFSITTLAFMTFNVLSYFTFITKSRFPARPPE
jgi:hypothetical protein